MQPGFDACQFFVLCRDRCVCSRREFFHCKRCARRALCGLTLFGRRFLPFLVWPKPRLRKSSRRAKKKTVSITKERSEPRMDTDAHNRRRWSVAMQLVDKRQGKRELDPTVTVEIRSTSVN